MYLLDTNVVSELRKASKAHPGVRAWAGSLPAASLYLSVISILELEIGVLLIERRDRKQGGILRAWMDEYVLPAFAGRILAIDTGWPSVAQLFTFPIPVRIAMLSLPPLRLSTA